MHKSIKVGIRMVNIEPSENSLIDFTYSHSDINSFIRLVESDGMSVISCTTTDHYKACFPYDTCAAYKITFSYKFSDRKNFKNKFIAMTTSDVILQYFYIV